MRHSYLLAAALLFGRGVHAQQVEKVQPAGKARNLLVARPLVGLADEVAATTRDFATFRDKQWSILTLAQIGAAAADAQTSLNNLHTCLSCSEIGVTRFFVGAHPDAHKYIVGDIVEIGVEAVAAHYFRNHGPSRNKYWRLLWTLPQSISLYEHAHAANHNAGENLACYNAVSNCE